MAGLSYLGGYNGSIEFRYPKNDFFDDSIYYFLRSIPGIFSSTVVPLSYLASRLYSLSKLASIFVSIEISTDLMMIAEGRLILTDSLLHFWVLITICLIPYTLGETNYNNLFLISLFLSFSISTKWTSGGILLFVLFIHLFDIGSKYSFNELFFLEIFKRFFFILIIIIFFVFFISSIHMSIFIYGSDFNSALSQKFNYSLHYDDEILNFTKRFDSPNFLIRTSEYLYSLFHYNIHISNISVESKPIEWPLTLCRWMCFSGTKLELTLGIGQLFNWTICFCFTLIATFILIKKFLKGEIKEEYTILLKLIFGFWISYGPFFLVTRAVYTYHYIIPAIFSYLITASFIEIFINEILNGFLFIILSTLAIFGYFFWCPFTYGLSLKDIPFRLWLNKWKPFLLE